MDAPTAEPLIHLYDTRLHAIRCGVKGAGLRSTKYVRGVSCEACIGAARRAPEDPPPDEPGTTH
jgi:hypothetical protein